MLGWYGLHDTNTNNSSIMHDTDLSPKHVEGDTGSPPFSASIPPEDGQHHTEHRPHTAESESQYETAQSLSIRQCENRKAMDSCIKDDSDGKDDITRLEGPPIQSAIQTHTPMVSFEGMAGPTNQNGIPADKKLGGRKLIGMRYLFPPPADGLSLLEKARVWVARHDYKYFVGWNDDQLSRVDPALRPICPITSDLYKMHMNRSEYCRNVKLKYCLESDTDWAQEFREKLAKPYNKGGFSGLCQAKIVAAELWRKHSENYKSHQARYPNPKSKYRARRMSSNLSDQTLNQGENMFNVPPNEYFKFNQDSNAAAAVYQRNEVLRASEPASIIRFMRSGSLNDCDGSRDSMTGGQTAAAVPSDDQPRDTTGMFGGVGGLDGVVIKQEFPAPDDNNDPGLKQGFDPSMMQGAMYPFEPFKSRAQQLFHTARDSYLNPPLNASITGTDTNNFVSHIKKNISGRNNDYRKSERGLSYLFPSLIDQQLSLLDKVRITVLRHKNNYFLGWTDEQLKRVDPLVRPKMPVTRELYKEYCHRNAMKYDSNLQFAMESQTSWAVDFRDRLVKPPNEGGFHSLCEVKQEAGRLWKEFSGRYKMHNVVKAQMDMNNEHSKTPTVLVERADSVCSSIVDDTAEFRSTASSPGPRMDRITSPLRKFISRSANSSPDPVCDVPMLRYPTADFSQSAVATDLHSSRKRKQSDDSGCASLPSPTPATGVVETDIYKHNFAPKPKTPTTADTHKFNNPPFRANFTFRDSISNNSFMHAKIPKLQRSSSGVASEVTNSMLFAPLPPELSVFNQLIIWLQRHRNNYFIGWPQGQIDTLNPFLRPLYVVTSDVLKSHVSPTMFAMFDKVEEVMAIPTAWAKSYKDKLGIPPEQGGFRTIEEALTEAVDIWMTHCQPKTSPPQEKDIPNPGLLRLRDMFRAKNTSQEQNVPKLSVSQRSDPSNTLEGLLHSKHVSNVSDAQGRDGRAMVRPSEAPTADEAVLDLSNKNTAITKTTNTEVVNDDKKERVSTASVLDSTKGVVLSSLWNCRKQLQELCRDSVASSWQDRLQPHIDLLHETLGENYQLPTSVSDCMVDLMLVLLHESLIKT